MTVPDVCCEQRTKEAEPKKSDARRRIRKSPLAKENRRVDEENGAGGYIQEHQADELGWMQLAAFEATGVVSPGLDYD